MELCLLVILVYLVNQVKLMNPVKLVNQTKIAMMVSVVTVYVVTFWCEKKENVGGITLHCAA